MLHAYSRFIPPMDPSFITTTILLLTLPYAATLSFQKTSFSPNDGDIIYERDAYPSNNAIQLTTNQRDVRASVSIGRATYHEPLHLWDIGSRNLTDFSTRFTFTINSLNSSRYGDGLAFFLAPNGSTVPSNVTNSGTLGLTRNDEALNSSSSPFVAVEFDVFQNTWDPKNEHVGIDISSMDSVKNVTWRSRIRQGETYEAVIRYDSSLNNLSVVFTGFGPTSTLHQRVSYIVDLRDHLPEWVTFGFSGATGNNTAVIHSIFTWDFSSNLGIGENAMDPSLGPGAVANPGPVARPKPDKSKAGLVAGLVIGCVLLTGLGLALFMLKRKKNGFKTEDDHVFVLDDEFEKGTGPKKFSYKELARATGNFAEEEKLGEGGFGGVYRGFMKEMDSYVAVKRVSRGSHQGIKEYASEVKTISRLRHRNLVQLVGWCHEKKELLLVYEFMLNGSLDSHLFYGKSVLKWPVRYQIVKGLASALLYLHAEWEQCVVHRDIKSSNVMLDSSFNAKLGDFGLARFVDHDKGVQTTAIAGTMGYMAPECVLTGQASRESDVYSFGVVALEIACGRKPMELKAPKNQIRLVEWVWDLYGQRKVVEASDSRLEGDYDEKEMECLMVVGLWCAHPDSSFRPSVRQVINVLNFQTALPGLPLKMPVPTYFTPSVNLQMSTTVSQSSHTQSSYGYNTDSSK